MAEGYFLGWSPLSLHQESLMSSVLLSHDIMFLPNPLDKFDHYRGRTRKISDAFRVCRDPQVSTLSNCQENIRLIRFALLLRSMP